MDRILQTFTCWIGIGYALSVAGLAVADPLLWSILILVWITEHLAHTAGKEYGMLLNGMAVMNLKQEVDELKERLEQYEQHSSTIEHEQQSM